MHALLIVEQSEIYTSVLTEQLCNEFQVYSSHDGESGLEMLSKLQPDVLVLNMSLPFKDGLTLLQETPYKPAVIIGLISSSIPYVMQRAYELGVDQLLICPTPSCVVSRVTDVLNSKMSPSQITASQKAVALLHTLQIPVHKSGYKLLCAALPMIHNDPEQSLTKELYPNLARVCNCPSAGAAEQSIRRAITAAWKSKNTVVWSKFFNVTGKCPTNLVFLSRLNEELDQLP